MSWDNVKGVSSAKIWTDNPDMTQAFLFANGNHQVKLTIGINFTLNSSTQAGPTADEVKAAFNLVDFETGSEISHLKSGDKDEYSYVYQPGLPMVVQAIEASDVGAYQYEFDYYLSSDSTINANYASEKVALLLSYIDTSGKEVNYSTASGSKSQSYVAVTMYPPKKYGTAGSSSTPVIIKLKDDKMSPTYNYSHRIDNLTVSTWSLRIDDNYFRIIKMQASSSEESPYPFYRHGTNTESGVVYDEDWETNEGFLLVENKLNQGHVSYNSTMAVTYDDQNLYFFEFTINVKQEPYEIIFTHFYAIILPPEETGFHNKTDTASLSAFDQFGNKINIEVAKTNDGFSVKNIT